MARKELGDEKQRNALFGEFVPVLSSVRDEIDE